MDIIVPAAGLSTRFPNMRPKYTLTDHNGKIMLYSALKPFLGKNTIYIGILKKHNEEYGVIDLLKHEFGDFVNIIILDEETKGPADTVYQILKKAKIKNNEILIKDCDSFFNHEYIQGNYICISQFANNDLIRRPNQKSYVLVNNQGVIQNITEKRIISDKFCVGGYKFESANLYCDAYETVSETSLFNEIYVSHIIQYCLHNNNIFVENMVKDYVDVGTSEEWFTYNDKSVIFCDIDGTIVEAQPKNGYGDSVKPLQNNVNRIKKLIQENHQVIFVTSRPESSRKETEETLKSLGFECMLIMGLKNCKRIVINDFNAANPYPRAIGVNIPRNSDTLESFI
jgi:hypothetical protein